MKVKDLIAELAKHDPEMEVFLYNELDEGDAETLYVQECGTPPGCQGDSFALEYLTFHPGERVVVIHNDWWVYQHQEDYFKFFEEEE